MFITILRRMPTRHVSSCVRQVYRGSLSAALAMIICRKVGGAFNRDIMRPRYARPSQLPDTELPRTVPRESRARHPMGQEIGIYSYESSIEFTTLTT